MKILGGGGVDFTVWVKVLKNCKRNEKLKPFDSSILKLHLKTIIVDMDE